jgi:hypothetical protein
MRKSIQETDTAPGAPETFLGSGKHLLLEKLAPSIE